MKQLVQGKRISTKSYTSMNTITISCDCFAIRTNIFRDYVSLLKNGKDIKEIARYDDDGKKLWAIHTLDHHGLSPHYHTWTDGKPSTDAYPLTQEMKQLLKKVKNYENNK